MGIRPIDWFAKTKLGTRIYKWAVSEKGQKFLYNGMPVMETAVATTLYVIATEKQNNLNRREKNVLQWQNVLSGVLGMSLGIYLNRKVFKFGDKIISKLDPAKIEDIHKIQGATRVLLPIATTALIMRFLAPVVTAYVSGVMEERKAEKQKLNLLA